VLSIAYRRFVPLMAAALAVAALSAPAVPPTVKQLWETTLAPESAEIEYKALAVSNKDESVWLMLGKRPALAMTGPQRLQLDTLDRAGKTVAETALDSLAKTAGLKRTPDHFLDLAATDEGNLAVVVSAAGQVSVILVDGKSRHVIQAREIGVSQPGLLITRCVPFAGGNLLLLGRMGAHAWAIRLDRKMAVVWEKPASAGDVTVFVDGAPLSGGNFIVGGASASKPGAATPASLWLGQLTADGQVTRWISLPGRFISVAPAPDGGAAAVQGTLSVAGGEFRLRSYDRNLKETGSSELLSGTRDLQPFRVAPAGQPPAEYVVLGSERHRLWLAKVRAGSAVLWSQTLGQTSSSMPDLVRNFGLQPAASTFVVAATEMVVNAKMQQRQVVKVMNLEIP
jgi:hypothetical protein